MSKPELAAERKNQIIRATIECISRYGYSNFSMQDVARVADVSKGIIHYYFLNKEDLMMAVLERVAGDIEVLVNRATEQAADPVDTIRAILKTMCAVVRDNREYYCINMDFWTQINQKDKVREAVGAHYAKFRSSLAVLIQDGINKGVFVGADASRIASQIIALVDGVSLQWLFDSNVFDYDEMVADCENLILNTILKK